MEVSEIEALTREHLPEFATGPMTLEAQIDRGGSGRQFLRFLGPGDARIVAMHFSLERPENGRFAAVTEFLEDHEVPVPAIRKRLDEKRLIWMEDLGPEDLAHFEKSDWETVRAPLYRATLEAVFGLHRIREEAQPEDLPDLEPPFDAGLYAWEQSYFFEHFAANFSDFPADRLVEIAGNIELRNLATGLSGEPRRLIHRDFQSSNIMIRNGRPNLIDYQGMRWGLPEYDVASLLFDPYVALSAVNRDELTGFYFSLKQAAGDAESFDEYRSRLDRCAAQRLMQALGAYGNLGLNKKQTTFLDHIPAALKKLREIALDRGAIPSLRPVLSLKHSHVA